MFFIIYNLFKLNKNKNYIVKRDELYAEITVEPYATIILTTTRDNVNIIIKTKLFND